MRRGVPYQFTQRGVQAQRSTFLGAMGGRMFNAYPLMAQPGGTPLVAALSIDDEAEPPPVPTLWWRGDDAVGSPVASWPSHGGHGPTLGVVTGAPTQVSSLNGKIGISFGPGDYVDSASFAYTFAITPATFLVSTGTGGTVTAFRATAYPPATAFDWVSTHGTGTGSSITANLSGWTGANVDTYRMGDPEAGKSVIVYELMAFPAGLTTAQTLALNAYFIDRYGISA